MRQRNLSGKILSTSLVSIPLRKFLSMIHSNVISEKKKLNGQLCSFIACEISIVKEYYSKVKMNELQAIVLLMCATTGLS